MDQDNHAGQTDDGAVTTRTDAGDAGDSDAGDTVVEELLVEEISIDGMCGVY